MVSKEEVKRFLSKLKPFIEKFPDITEKISILTDDKQFQDLLGRLGTVGGLFSIGLYLFDKTLQNLSDTEKTYYSLINRTAISVAEKIIKEEVKEMATDEQNNEDILKQMMKIYSFKEFEKEEYKKWNGLAVDHPIVKHFRENIIALLEDNNLSTSQYFHFATEFNSKFKEEVKNNSTFLKYQKQKLQKNLSQKRLAYLQWLLKNIDKPNPIDGGKKVTDYYVQYRAIEFDLEQHKETSGQNKDYWNMSDVEAKDYFIPQKKWTIDDFLNSQEDKDPVKYIAAPFGTGKTSFAKYTVLKIVNDYLSGQDTWIPIYVELKDQHTRDKLASFYRPNVEISHDLRDIIKPEDEKILFICDGLDEYPIPDGILSLKDYLLNSPSHYSISDLKIIFTTRLEAGFPHALGIKRYVRLLPFSPEQVTEFFKRYGHQNLTYKDIEKYGLQEKDEDYFYKIDLLKPLFCWMFAISYPGLEVTENMDVGIARLILYSKFIHSILEGRYQYSREIVKEKWIMRKIAALKMMSEDLYEEDLSELLQTFVKEEKQEIIKLENIKLHVVLTSYFKLNEKGNNKHSIDFLHKSFQEYLLAEYYIESILYNKGFRLDIGPPSSVTIEFLSSLLSMIRHSDKNEYEKHLVRIIRSLYPNKAEWPDQQIIQMVKEFRNQLLDKAVEIFKENKLVYNDFENKTVTSEFWNIKDIPDHKKLYENFIYKAISLFVIKNLDPTLNPSSIIDFIRDSYNILPKLRYFPYVDLTGVGLDIVNLVGVNLSGSSIFEANLAGVNLRGADLYNTNLTGSNLTGADLAGVNLSEAHLYNTNLTGANLTGARFTGADLYNTNLTGANLTGADLAEVNFLHAKLIGSNFTGADLSHTNLAGVNVTEVNFSQANLTGADLYNTNLAEANLAEANLTGADLSHAKLIVANLTGANLTGANLTGANLTGADLYNTNLTGSNLTGADLSDANLAEVNFSQTNLAEANLAEAIILKPINFTNSIINDTTKFNAAITDDIDLCSLVKSKIEPGNSPKLIETKEELIKELQRKSYTDDQINEFISQSKFV